MPGSIKRRVMLPLCTLTFLCVVSVASFGADHTSIRALFDEDYYWITKEGADELLDRAESLGFNVIVPCVWHGRGTTWPSKIAPLDDRYESIFSGGGGDPLGYLIREARKRHIQIHPWFTVFLKRRDFLQEHADPTVPDMFDIHSEGYRHWMVGLIGEFLTLYDVDGLNLDYIRAKKICVTPSCEEDYTKKTGRSLVADYVIRHVNRQARASLQSWQLASVTDAVELISAAARDINPDIIISVDTLVNNPAWLLLGAGAVDWLNRGTIDIAFHMDYRDPMKESAILRGKSALSEPEKMILLMGNRMDVGERVIARAPVDVTRLINDALRYSPKAKSFGLYKYKFLTSEQEIEIVNTGPYWK